MATATKASMPRQARARGEAVEVAGVRVSHPGRVLYPEIGFTKEDLARLYARIGDWIVPHVCGRPLTLVCCPNGLGRHATASRPDECFFMKHSRLWGPSTLRRVKIREKTKIGEYMVADDLASVIALVQMDVLEIHTWNSTADRVEQPDRLVFDLDPGPEVSWAQVIDAARLVRSILKVLELESFVKTTGGKGLHVVVPLVPERDWSECLAFARSFAQAVVRSNPRLYTVAFARSGRESKILVDYLRNNRTNTSVAAFSTRARPHAPVSTPLRWQELKPETPPDRFTVRTICRRLEHLRADPWQRYWTTEQQIEPRAERAVASL